MSTKRERELMARLLDEWNRYAGTGPYEEATDNMGPFVAAMRALALAMGFVDSANEEE